MESIHSKHLFKAPQHSTTYRDKTVSSYFIQCVVYGLWADEKRKALSFASDLSGVHLQTTDILSVNFVL